MKDNLIFLLFIGLIILTYGLLANEVHKSMKVMVSEMEQQMYTIGVRNETDLLNINSK